VISLEQVRALESRVEKAVSYIAALRTENAELRRRVEEEQTFIDAAAAELEAAESGRAAADSRVAELERKLAEADARAAELADHIEEYKRDQLRIEEGIVHALEKLDSFEDLILGQTVSPPRGDAETVEFPSIAAASTPIESTQASGGPRPGELAAAKDASANEVPRAPEPELPGTDSQLDIF
jgi:chromosome segregation ATPase